MDKKTQAKVQTILKETGALKEGHFKLSSGLHSQFYLQCALVLQYPEYAELLGKSLAKNLQAFKIETVVSPALGGIIIGQEVARALGVRAIFAERVEGKFILRRGFELQRGEKVLIVEDVVTTGGSSLEIKELVESKGGEVMGFAAICDRSFKSRIGAAITGYKPYSLLQFDFENYKAEECPLCLKKIPLSAPGTRFIKAG